MKQIELNWKQFYIPVDKLNSILKTIVGNNYDGLVCYSENFFVSFKEEPIENEINLVLQFWNTVTPQQFSPSLREIIAGKINEASVFGRTLILDFAVENVQMGITQAQKTREVADYLRGVQRYLESGSLYAALAATNEMISGGVPSNLAPFVTQQRLELYRDRIEDFLNG